MKKRSISMGTGTGLCGMALACALLCVSVPASAQTANGGIPRAASGKPDLNGIWQAMNVANWELEAHGSEAAPVSSLGALGAVPPGESLVEGGTIPYLPGAVAQRKANRARRWVDDPEIKCYMPGVPRGNYMPYPFQIVQGADTILMSYQFAGAVRTVRFGNPGKSPGDSWMGWSVGRWEGDTLVIDVTSFNDQTWLDRSGNYHSDALHVVERYTPSGPNVLMYEATMEDPKVFSRPWKISMPLYRHLEKNAHLLEFQCIEYAEDVLYGPLKHGKGDAK